MEDLNNVWKEFSGCVIPTEVLNQPNGQYASFFAGGSAMLNLVMNFNKEGHTIEEQEEYLAGLRTEISRKAQELLLMYIKPAGRLAC